MSSNVSSILSGLTGSAKQDQAVLGDLGSKVNSAESNFNSAVSTGDPGKIAQAQMVFNQASQALQAKIGVMDALNKMIQQIINSIGLLGQ